MDGQRAELLTIFPNYTPSKLMKDYFVDTHVEKMKLNPQVKILHIFVESPRIIPYVYVKQMAEELISSAKKVAYLTKTVKLHMHYSLSGQYNLEDICKEYRDGFLEELKEQDPIFYLLLKDSEEWVIEENVITIPMPDNSLARLRCEELAAALENILKERFDREAHVGFSFRQEDKEKLRKAHEQRKQLEIEDQMRQQNLLSDKEENQEEETKHADSPSASDNPKSKDEKAGDDKTKSKTKRGHDTAKEKQGAEKQGGDPYGRRSRAVGAARRRTSQRFGLHTDEEDGVFYGQDCEGDVTKIIDILEDNTYVIQGTILSLESKDIMNKTTGEVRSKLYSFTITDFTDTITGKLFINLDDVEIFEELFQTGKCYVIKGIVGYDDFIHETAITRVRGIKPGSLTTQTRIDKSLEKRVELHMHTTMSEKDSVVDLKKIINRAKAWGHKAIAITDHGVVHCFPEAAKCLDKNDTFKILYGVEAYIVDDLKNLVTNPGNQTLYDEFVVFDIETTGKNAKFHAITEIGAVKIRKGVIVDRFSQLINPHRPIPYNITRLTNITDEMVMNQPDILEVLPRFLDFCKDAVLVAHNADFDTGFIRRAAKEQGLPFDPTVIDTLGLAHVLCPELRKYTLDALCKRFAVVLDGHHRAVNDAEATSELFLHFIHDLMNRGIDTVRKIYNLASADKAAIKKMRRRHAVVLAKNEIGRVHLYRLISDSHTEYLQGPVISRYYPVMPKSQILKYREGLLLGSACSSGELYQAMLMGADDAELARIVNFYDYLEIQPIGNNRYLLEDDGYAMETEEDLREKNREILRLGEEFGKPVVATGDVHFLDPEDSVYRSIIQASMGNKNPDDQPPLYFHTTDEMLEEFAYLGPEKAHEVVIDAPNRIADMVEYISPVRPDKCPPQFDNSDEELRNICYTRAHEIYGEELPQVVKDRLDRELNSIISNGYAVLYIIAQKLVANSNSRGYLVGSRGSVGSSFVATMAGITEVNPLSAHYICPQCHYYDFDSEEVKAFSGNSGCDLPDKVCPKCGAPLQKEGHDIPFETFLGFKGDKEPDIDLNFSGEDQSNAHRYTEELFPNEHAFRAGTITAIAEKTAYGMTRKYYEERGLYKRKCEIDRRALGCTGVKSSTGQHPGGMIVLPQNEEIYSFTPIQYPANDVNASNKTTHFDYHKIEHNLLKLDILGHDDPSMIRRLEDLTGIDCKTIPLDDKQVMSLFQGTEVLDITPEDIGGVPLGTLGVPEFGTQFAMQMLIDAKPTMFSDLVRIAGLSHGTDVWLGNAKDLIMSGTCVISTAICCRDDIMVYLIHKGLDKGMAFDIMEKVRKGIVAKGKCDKWPMWREEMRKHDVPEWYIGSCEKIKYMFPKAHAVAYVMMGWRVAWFKLYYPLEYYAAYFSIRADNIDYEKMCMGKEKLLFHMREIQEKERNKTASDVEIKMLKDMRSVLEMYARKFEFLPIDIFQADAMNFTIIDGKLMPSLNSIDKLGDVVAKQIQEAASIAKEHGGFSSKQNFATLAKVGKTVLENFDRLHLLDGLPETDQYSLFDYI